MDMPAYVTHRLAVNAVCTVINRHGWEALGVGEFEEAIAPFEDVVYQQGKFAFIDYDYQDQRYQLTYEWINYE